eukprot:14888_1
MSMPNTYDVGDGAPMLKDQNQNGKKMHGLGGIFRKNKPGSPRKRQSNHHIQRQRDSSNNSNNKQINNRNSKNNHKQDSNIFAKLSKMGKIFKSSKTDTSSNVNKQINSKLKQEEASKTRQLNMLLLGAGGSGKTTVFKQMDKLYNGDIDEKQLENQYESAKAPYFINIDLDMLLPNYDRNERFQIYQIEIRWKNKTFSEVTLSEEHEHNLLSARQENEKYIRIETATKLDD